MIYKLCEYANLEDVIKKMNELIEKLEIVEEKDKFLEDVIKKMNELIEKLEIDEEKDKLRGSANLGIVIIKINEIIERLDIIERKINNLNIFNVIMKK